MHALYLAGKFIVSVRVETLSGHMGHILSRSSL